MVNTQIQKRSDPDTDYRPGQAAARPRHSERWDGQVGGWKDARRHKAQKHRRVAVISFVLLVTLIAVAFGGAVRDFVLSVAPHIEGPPGRTLPLEPQDRADYGWNGPNASEFSGLGELLLVNATHPIPNSYKDVDTVLLAGIIPVESSSVLVAREIEEPLIELFDAAMRAGYRGIYVNSGYRTEEEQRQLYEAAKDKSYVQQPGYSEHQTGLAVDIASTNSGENDALLLWLSNNAWHYGFILRYPEDKLELTGISYEPWHFRYVGKEVAQICYEQNLCLEEYLQ